jgi:DNA polymerase I-like protein with 3'-5' exonuclease and polymerase domains
VGNRDEGEGGTNTGRLSAVDPAFQTIPVHTKWAPRIRRCFPAPPGYVIVARDYDQGELKVVACVADESTMLGAYKDGKDLHALTGADFLGISYEEMTRLKVSDPEKFANARQAAKPANFGLLYGQGEDGFRIYSEQNYGVKMTAQEAHIRRELFFKRYPGLLTFHQVYKSFARKHGYVRSPLGRIRHSIQRRAKGCKCPDTRVFVGPSSVDTGGRAPKGLNKNCTSIRRCP